MVLSCYHELLGLLLVNNCILFLFFFCSLIALAKMNTLALIKVLNDYMAEYEALCSMKQVTLICPPKTISAI
jgi:hypothetical protein